MTFRAYASYTHKLPQTDPYRSRLGIAAINMLARLLKSSGLAHHNAYVDTEFAEGASHEPVFTTFTTLPATFTLAQADEVLNVLKGVAAAHLADGQFAHFAADTTSPAVTAGAAVDTPTRVALATQLSATMYAHWHTNTLNFHHGVGPAFNTAAPTDDTTTRARAREMLVLYMQHIQSAALEFMPGET